MLGKTDQLAPLSSERKTPPCPPTYRSGCVPVPLALGMTYRQSATIDVRPRSSVSVRLALPKIEWVKANRLLVMLTHWVAGAPLGPGTELAMKKTPLPVTA